MDSMNSHIRSGSELQVGYTLLPRGLVSFGAALSSAVILRQSVNNDRALFIHRLLHRLAYCNRHSECVKSSCMSFILWESKGFNLSGTPSNATASNGSRPTFLYHAPTIPAIGISIPVVYEALSLRR